MRVFAVTLFLGYRILLGTAQIIWDLFHYYKMHLSVAFAFYLVQVCGNYPSILRYDISLYGC